MAKKAVTIQPLEYIVGSEWLNDEAKEAYRFLISENPNSPNYAVRRAQHTNGFRCLWLYMKWCDLVSESIKASMKSAMSVATGSLPAGISWAAESMQTSFKDAVKAALALAEHSGIAIEQFTANLTPTQAMKISGVDKDTLVEIVGDNYVQTPKEKQLLVH